MKKRVFALCLSLIMLVSLCACGSDETEDEDEDVQVEYDDGITNVAVSLPPSTSPWDASFAFELQKTLEADEALNPIFKISTDVDDQIAGIKAFAADDSYDLLMIYPTEDELFIEAIEEIRETSDLPIFLLNRDLDTEEKTAVISAEDYGCGVTAANYAREFFEKENRVNFAVIRTDEGSLTDERRYEGFMSVISTDPHFTNLGEAYGSCNSNSGYEAMNQLLKSCPDLDYVYVEDDEALNGALSAIYYNERTDISLITGIGGTMTAMQTIQSDSSIHKMSASRLPADVAATVDSVINLYVGTGFCDPVITAPSYEITAETVGEVMEYAYE